MSLAVKDQRLILRTRRDLSFIVREDDDAVVAKDPVSLQYHLLTAEEYTLLELLSEPCTLETIKARLEHQFFPKRTSTGELSHAIGLLHRRGLLTSADGSQGERLFERVKVENRRRWLAILNPLFIRFPGFFPDRLFNALYPSARWMFSPVVQSMAWAFVAFVILMLAANLDTLIAELPSEQALLQLGKLPLLMLAVAFAKVLHELAHGLACKHFGCEVQELGFAMFLFTPCLYCDTSDTWTLTTRTNRMWVGAAGMIMEVFLASIAALCWLRLSDGIVRDQCLMLVISCSVSTIAFNANPLLKYDGYYILSDYLGVANLWSRSRSILSAVCLRLCTGLEVPIEVRLSSTQLFMFFAYGLASVCYRWLVLGASLYFVFAILDGHEFGGLGLLFALFIISSSIAISLWPLAAYCLTPGRIRLLKWTRLFFTCLSQVAILYVMFSVPIPFRIHGEAVVTPIEETNIFVKTSGRLDRLFVSAGDQVEIGQPLAELRSEELEQRAVEVSNRLEMARVRLVNLQRQRGRNDVAASQLETTEQLVKHLSDQMLLVHREQAQLTILSTQAGKIFPTYDEGHNLAHVQDESSLMPPEPLLDPSNLGRMLPSGTKFCRIFEPEQVEVTCRIAQKNIQYVEVGMLATILLDGLVNEVTTGHVVAIATVPSSGESKTDSSPQFDVRIQLDNTQPLGAVVGLHGKVRVHARSVPLVFHMRRKLRELFRI